MGVKQTRGQEKERNRVRSRESRRNRQARQADVLPLSHDVVKRLNCTGGGQCRVKARVDRPVVFATNFGKTETEKNKKGCERLGETGKEVDVRNCEDSAKKNCSFHVFVRIWKIGRLGTKHWRKNLETTRRKRHVVRNGADYGD